MKGLRRWNILMAIAFLASVVFCAYLGWHEQWAILAAVILITILSLIAFMGLWNGARKKRIEAEVDITRFLGRDAKDALNFGNIGLLTYDDEYNVTWTSEFFKERNIDIVNKRVTSWIREIRTLFEEEVDYVIGYNNSAAYEITRKEDSNVLFVRDVTEYERLRRHSRENSVVVGMMVLDNYMEYQAYENEEIMAAINVNLRSALINWAKERGMLIRRLRSDRFFLVLNTEIFDKARQEDFSILQTIKDHAKQMDISITLSMAFAYGTNNYAQLDAMVNQLIELAQSRGGDQVAFRHVDGTIQYVGGNSESSSQRSKVRVHTMAQSIQGAMLEAGNIFIAGHVDSDFDCMGSALGVSSWVKSIGKTANIVLKDVPRDVQLQNAMDYYRKNLVNRHHFISPEQADAMIDPKSDLLIMVDHGVPAISSASAFISRCRKIIVIDHHRRGSNFVPNSMLAYVE
ncbi:MAG: DHH family phosphoesterase, partial [Erysipelotrichaceae bacterium]|nr:DHH family phosphoesterase [Erysipelotrichaceae bacterium]